MIKMSCPYCEAIHEVRKIKRTESIMFTGKSINYEAVHYECSNCHEIFDSAQMMDENLLAARKQKRLAALSEFAESMKESWPNERYTRSKNGI